MRGSHRSDFHDAHHGLPRTVEIYRGWAERDRHVLLPLHDHRTIGYILGQWDHTDSSCCLSRMLHCFERLEAGTKLES
jgi:hypothetical protein